MTTKKKTKLAGARVFALGIAALMLTAGPTQAAPIEFFLDQSNVFADGVNYLKVTIDDGDNGDIDFTVEALGPLLDLADHKFGIKAFAFNVIPGGFAEANNVDNLLEGWRARDNRRMDGFGFFDIRLKGGRVDTLTFSIEDIDGDTPADYASLSHGNAGQGHAFFAAKVSGLINEDCLDSKKKKCKKISAYFGGSTAVPLPGAAWLFGTGVVGVIVRARRRAVGSASAAS